MTPKKKDPKTTKSPKKAVKPDSTKTSKSSKTNKSETSKVAKVTTITKPEASKALKSPKTPKTGKPDTSTLKKSPKSTKSKTKTTKSSTKTITKSGTSKAPTKTSKNAKTANKSKKIIGKSKVSKLSLRERAVLSNTARLLKARKSKLPKKQIKSSRGVVYLRNIPHGFYEVEMRKFFSQFGQVTGVRIPKSTRTGKYRGYAFVEFMYPDVAKIVAETMNNYLMYKRVVKAKYLPAEEQKPHTFKFPSFKVPLTVRRKQFLRQQSNRVLTEEQCEKEKKRLDDCVQKKLNKLKKLGINYEFQVASKESTNSQETTV